MDEDIKNINPNNSFNSIPKDFKSMRGKNKNKKVIKILSISVAVLGVFILFILFAVVLPMLSLTGKSKLVMVDAKQAYADIKAENVALASTDLSKTQTDLTSLKDGLAGLSYLRFIPIANFYYNDATHLVNAGEFGLDGSKVLVDSIAPYADVLGLKGKGSFVGGSADQRIQTAVETLSKITPNIDKISSYIAKARLELDQVNINHYPPIGKLKTLRDQLKSATTIADDASTFLNQATPLVRVLPDLLGATTPQKYLVIFQNNAELRPTGGFMTGYSIINLDKGRIVPQVSNDIYTLDATVPNKPVAPRPILDFLPNVSVLNLRDSNLSPDFETSMKEFNKLYRTAGDYVPVDGIIAMDTYPLIDAIRVLGGEITADGTTFKTTINPICDCADAIYQLELNTDLPVNYVKTNRKGILGDLMVAILSKALSSSPKIYWGPLFQALITDAAQKHILFDLNNSDAQTSIEALNVAGQIKPFNGDYFAFNEANFGGEKSNLFVNESVAQNYNIASDGSITKTVTVSYKNPYPPSNCSLKDISLCLNATLRDWFRIYVPQGSTLVSDQGSEVKMTSYNELGKTVFDGFLTVRPLGIASLSVTYKLPFKLASDSILPLLIQKQPGTNDNPYTISINGKQVNSFPLLEDETLTLKP